MTRTYGRLALRGDQWVVSDLEPHVAIRFKKIFPKVPMFSKGPFMLMADGHTAADLAWFTSRYPLDAPAETLALMDLGRARYEAVQAEAGRIKHGDYAPPEFVGLRPGQEVRDHQARNVALLHAFGGLLVGDKIGKGKTYTGGAACLLPGALPALVVCPPHLKGQWKRKLEAFTTLDVHLVTGGRPYALDKGDVWVVGFTQIASWIDVLAASGFGLLIIEEGHALRRGVGTPSQPVAKGVACLTLSELARYRLMLTGTPVFNYGEEIWQLLRYVRPEVLGDEADFRREWCSGRLVRDPDALGAFLREQNAFVREEGDDPPANVILQTVDHDVQRIESVRELAEQLARTARTGSWHERGEARRELALKLRMETGIAKAPAVANYVRMVVEAGEPVILFGWHREVWSIWQEMLGDLGMVLYTGSETSAQKDRAKAKFMAGEAKIFGMSLRSGEGVDDLQHHCSTAIVGEMDWSPVVHDQCVGRLNREGQPRWVAGGKVDAIFLIADDGSDPVLVDVLGLKASQAHHIADPGTDPVKRDEAEAQRAMDRLVDRYFKRERAA